MTPDQIKIATVIAHHTAKRYAVLHRMDAADLAQEGLLALHRFRHRYDPTRGTWRQFARLWVTQGIRRAGAIQGRLIRIPEHEQQKARDERRMLPDAPISLDAPTETGSGMDYRDESPDALALCELAELPGVVSRALDALPHDLAIAVRGFYIDEMSMTSIGRAVGSPHSTIANRIQAALPLLRVSLEAA